MNLQDAFNSTLNTTPVISLLIVFIAGVITSFTPCVYPMIPIIIGYVGGKSIQNKKRIFILLLFYSFGLALNFAILGLIASLTGKIFGQIQSSPLVHFVVGNVIIFFGLSLLGVFSIPIPGFFRKQVFLKNSGSFIGAFGMGFASGLIAAPCTSAVLGALLTYVSTKQHLIMGALLLFSFGLGVSAFLLIIGLTGNKILALPQFAKFSSVLEKIFGYFMILLGEYFIFKAGMLSI